MGLSIQEKKLKTGFQDDNCGGHLVFLMGVILQATLMGLTKFRVSWTYESGEEAKKKKKKKKK